MTQTHTSGPWGVNELAAGNPDCYLIGNDGRKVEIGHIVQFGSMPVAATIKNIADARLIAAAPDMLAALEMLAEYEDNAVLYEAMTDCRFMQIVRDAIAKAKGQG